MTEVEELLKKKKNTHLWAKDPDEYYVEPEWCSRRLFAVEPFDGNVVDPFCGSGRVVRAAIDVGLDVRGYDLRERSPQCLETRDFASDDWMGSDRVDNIVGNPPFKWCGWQKGHTFIRLALARAERKVALLLPNNFDVAEKNAIFLETTPFRKKLILTPRPSMPPGRVIEAGVKPGGGREDFAWFIWLRGYDGDPTEGWIRRDG